MATDTFLRTRKSQGEGRIYQWPLFQAKNSQWEDFTWRLRRLEGTCRQTGHASLWHTVEKLWIQCKGVTSPLESGQSIYPWPSPLRTQEGGGDCHQLQSQSLSLSPFPQGNWLCGFRLQSAGLKKKNKTLNLYLFLQNLSEVSIWKHTSGNSKNEIQHTGFLKVTSLWNACLCSIWKALMFWGKPFGKHWSHQTSFTCEQPWAGISYLWGPLRFLSPSVTHLLELTWSKLGATLKRFL